MDNYKTNSKLWIYIASEFDMLANSNVAPELDK